MQFGELPVGIGELDLDRPLRLGPAAAHFSARVFEAAIDHDGAVVFGAGHRIDNRLAALLDVASHLQPCPPLLDVDFEVDVGEDGIVELGQCGRKNIEHRGARLGVLPAHDAQYRVPLRWIGALVDDRERLAVAEMDRSRPGEHPGDSQAVKFGVAMVTSVDLHADHGGAVAVGRQGVELARTTVRAIAIGKFATVDGPFGVSHGKLPIRNGKVRVPGNSRLNHPYHIEHAMTTPRSPVAPGIVDAAETSAPLALRRAGSIRRKPYSALLTSLMRGSAAS